MSCQSLDSAPGRQAGESKIVVPKVADHRLCRISSHRHRNHSVRARKCLRKWRSFRL